MDFEALQTALAALILALLSDVTNVAVQWENEPRKMAIGPNVLLSWVSGAGVGVDEVRWEDTGAAVPNPDLEPTAVGARRLVLQVAPETTANQKPGAPHARAVAEKLRTRLLGRTSAKAALRAANLGLVGVGDVTPADYEADQRMVSRCVIEVTLNATSFDRDAAGAASSIATVEVTSEVSDVGGTLLPDAEQMDHEVLP